MEKEFVPYDLALALKEFGFDEPCICCYDIEEKVLFHCLVNNVENNTLIDCNIGLNPKEDIKAPTFSQAFRFFREKYDLMFPINKDDIGQYYFSIPNSNRLLDTKCYCFVSYEEAEFECLVKLIEIVKNK